jgi:hypothetical protein
MTRSCRTTYEPCSSLAGARSSRSDPTPSVFSVSNGYYSKKRRFGAAIERCPRAARHAAPARVVRRSVSIRCMLNRSSPPRLGVFATPWNAFPESAPSRSRHDSTAARAQHRPASSLPLCPSSSLRRSSATRPAAAPLPERLAPKVSAPRGLVEPAGHQSPLGTRSRSTSPSA